MRIFRLKCFHSLELLVKKKRSSGFIKTLKFLFTSKMEFRRWNGSRLMRNIANIEKNCTEKTASLLLLLRDQRTKNSPTEIEELQENMRTLPGIPHLVQSHADPLPFAS